VEWVVREGVGAGGRNDPSILCTYETIKKYLKKKTLHRKGLVEWLKV
jgi:hypothetical protein